MIKMVLAVRHPENADLTCPVLVCEVCDQEVTAERPALVVWGRSTPYQLRLAHKGQCDRTLAAVLGKDRTCNSREVKEFLDHLLMNFEEPLADDPTVHEVRR